MSTAISETEQLYWNIFETASDGMLISDLETGRVLAANPAAAGMHGYTRKAFIGLRLQGLIHAKSLSFFTDFAQSIRQGGLFETLAQHVRQDGLLLSVEWRAAAFEYQGRTCALALLRDVSTRIQAEDQLRQRVGVRAHEQSTLLEISQTLASSLELQPDLILDRLGLLIKYTHAALFTLKEMTLVSLAVRGIPGVRPGRGKQRPEKSAPLHIQLSGRKTLEALFNGHRPIRIGDLSSDEPSAKFLRTLLENNSAALLEGVRSWLWVPLAVKNRMIGGIGIAHTRRNYFTSHQSDLAMTVANQVAVALDNAELYEHARSLAALQERQRLAQNLHDAVNQSLFSAGLIAEVLPRLWDRDQGEARKSLEDLRRLTRGALAEMRELLAELRPSVLTDSSLGDLLRQQANAFTGRTNIPAAVTINGEGSLPAETQVALYRICQEALNNIAKHAVASQVEIDLKFDTDAVQASSPDAHDSDSREVVVNMVEMRIRDDGLGFDPGGINAPGHYGLGMMRERAEAVGAQLTVTSNPGHGSEVTLRWSGNAKQEAL